MQERYTDGLIVFDPPERQYMICGYCKLEGHTYAMCPIRPKTPGEREVPQNGGTPPRHKSAPPPSIHAAAAELRNVAKSAPPPPLERVQRREPGATTKPEPDASFLGLDGSGATREVYNAVLPDGSLVQLPIGTMFRRI